MENRATSNSLERRSVSKTLPPNGVLPHGSPFNSLREAETNLWQRLGAPQQKFFWASCCWRLWNTFLSWAWGAQVFTRWFDGKFYWNLQKKWQWIEGELAAKMCDCEDLTPNWTETVIWRNCGGGRVFAKNRNFVKLSLATLFSARILNMAVKWLIVLLLLWQGKTILAYLLFNDVNFQLQTS